MKTLSTIEVENMALNGTPYQRHIAELELAHRQNERDELNGGGISSLREDYRAAQDKLERIEMIL